MTEISRLLAQSLKAHHDAKRARHDRKPALCRELWQTALNARVEADMLDPQHTDPAWAEEQMHTPGAYDTHTELLQFYAERGVVYQAPQTIKIQPIERVPRDRVMCEIAPENAIPHAVETTVSLKDG